MTANILVTTFVASLVAAHLLWTNYFSKSEKCKKIIAFTKKNINLTKPNNKNRLLNFPNELLLTILDRVPVRDLTCTLPRVCSQLAHLSAIACHRRQSLSLIYGINNFSSPNIFEQNLPENARHTKCIYLQRSIDILEFANIFQLNAPLCTKLVSTFPNIRSLQLTAYGINSMQLLQSIIGVLLTELCAQLETLQLVLYFDYLVLNQANAELVLDDLQAKENLSTRMLQRVLTQINTMPQLGRLLLFTTGKFGQLVPAQLSVVGQLSEFYICSSDIIHGHPIKSIQLTETLLQYGIQNLKRIGLGTFTVVDDRLIKGIHRRSVRLLVSKITHLSLDIFRPDIDSIDGLDKFFPHLQNLCSLSIYWKAHIPLVQLMKALAPVTKQYSKLTNLTLTICPNLEFQFGEYNTAPLDLSSLVSSVQLASIKKLYFLFDTISHLNYDLFHFDAIFPNLESIHCHNCVIHCSVCSFVFDDYFVEHSQYQKKRSQCIELIVPYLKQIPSKPRITFTYASRSRHAEIDLKF